MKVFIDQFYRVDDVCKTVADEIYNGDNILSFVDCICSLSEEKGFSVQEYRSTALAIHKDKRPLAGSKRTHSDRLR